jgi:hypothetical protein
MFQVTLTENRSTPQKFVAITRYERRGNRLVKVRRVYDGPNHVSSIKEIPWQKGANPRVDWTSAYNGEKGDGAKGHHNQPFTMKRDWLQIHQELQMTREGK